MSYGNPLRILYFSQPQAGCNSSSLSHDSLLGIDMHAGRAEMVAGPIHFLQPFVAGFQIQPDHAAACDQQLPAQFFQGFAVMFNPSAFDWADHDAVLGNVLLLLSALAWSVSILYTRAHHWLATPFQLVFWQALLATVVLTILALILEGELHIRWSNPLIMWFAYSGVVGTALGFLAMTVVIAATMIIAGIAIGTFNSRAS